MKERVKIHFNQKDLKVFQYIKSHRETCLKQKYITKIYNHYEKLKTENKDGTQINLKETEKRDTDGMSVN